MKVEVYLTTIMEISHVAPIVRALLTMGVDAKCVSPQTRPKAMAYGWDDADATEALLDSMGLPWAKTPDYDADCVLTIQSAAFVAPYRNIRIRMSYGVGLVAPDEQRIMPVVAKDFDYYLVHGPFEQRVQFKYYTVPSPMLPAARVKVIGYPRFDEWFTTFDHLLVARYQDLARNKPILLWLPTWGRSSSIDRYLDAIVALSDKYQIWVKPHHGTVTWERERMVKLAETPFRIIDFTDPPEPSFAAASVVLADLSSGAFSEAVFLNKRLVGLSTFSEIANLLVPINHSIPIACTPDHLMSAIGTSELTASRRTEIRPDLFDSTEGADGQRAAKTVVECLC